ncbi:UNVERIFIED_CONTAM: hypothetical protein Slati_2424900 [Sesamum latifolium]|uniref:Uncharacterized protein n=1 Tax=Sesamum latifolium TaxID=2727402 RepID=A0AAW2WCF5_9LAMI
MFKYLRDYATGEHGGGTPPSRSPRGTPASSGSKGKRPVSPSLGVILGGPSKRTRASSLVPPPHKFFQVIVNTTFPFHL